MGFEGPVFGKRHPLDKPGNEGVRQELENIEKSLASIEAKKAQIGMEPVKDDRDILDTIEAQEEALRERRSVLYKKIGLDPEEKAA